MCDWHVNNKFLLTYILTYIAANNLWLINNKNSVLCVLDLKDCVIPQSLSNTRNVGNPKDTPTWWLPWPSKWCHWWTKVHGILGQCRGSFAVSNPVYRLSISDSSREILSLKVVISVAKSSKMVVLGPQIFGGQYPKNIFVMFYCWRHVL